MCCLWAGGLVCVCMCVLSLYFCPKCIVTMCRVLAMHLSRCVVWVGGLVCVCVFIICALNALSRCVVFRQCTCQDVSSLGRGPCVCVHVCVCACLPFYFCPKCIVMLCQVIFEMMHARITHYSLT